MMVCETWEFIEINRLSEEHACFRCNKKTRNYFPSIEDACCSNECAHEFWHEFLEARGELIE